MTHSPQRVSPRNRPAKAVTAPSKQHARGTGSHSTPERLKQWDAAEVSHGRLCSLTFRLLARRCSLKRSCCLCKNKNTEGSCTDCTAEKQRGWGMSLPCHAKGLQKKTYIHICRLIWTQTHTHTLYTPGTMRSYPPRAPGPGRAEQGTSHRMGFPFISNPNEPFWGQIPAFPSRSLLPQIFIFSLKAHPAPPARELCFSPSFISSLQWLAWSC